MIYFIQPVSGGLIKIGFAIDPQKRLAEIQRMSPATLQILATIEGDRKREAELHQRFAGLRIYGEWFRAEKRLLDFIGPIPERGTLRRARKLAAGKRRKAAPLAQPSKPLTHKEIVEATTLQYYKPSQAAQMIGISIHTIRVWIRSGKLKAIRPGGETANYRISLKAIEAAKAEIQTAPA